MKNLKNTSVPKPVIPFIDLAREWRYFEKSFSRDLKNFGRAGQYVLGDYAREFEEEFAAQHGYKYGLTVTNGLAALKIALLAKGLQPGDEVITVANSAVATALAISQIGAKPVFCDIKDDFLMDEALLEGLITSRTKAILPVHLFGKISNLEVINQIAARHRLFIIEDACQAHGANFAILKKGTGLVNAKAFSFYPTKNLGALGEGGLILTNEESVRNFASAYRNYGQNGRYNHLIKGDNNRINSLQCAFLKTKLSKLSEFISRRRQLAEKYCRTLAGLKELFLPENIADSANHLFVIRVGQGRRDALKDFLQTAGIETLIHYPRPIHQQACYIKEYPDLHLAKTEQFQEEILSLPLYPFLKDREQDYVIAKIKEFFS